MRVSDFKFNISRAALLLLASVLSVNTPLFYESADAQIASWVNANNGFYEGSQNWVPNVPEPSDTAVFGVPGIGHYQIGFLADQMAGGLLVGNNVDISFAPGGGNPGAKIYQVSGDASVEAAMLELMGAFELRTESMSIDEDGMLRIESGASLLTAMTYDFGELSVVGTDLTGKPSIWNSDSAFITRGASLEILDGARASSNDVFVAISEFSEVTVAGNDAMGQSSKWSTGNLSSGLFDGGARFEFGDGATVTSETVFFRGNSVANISGASASGKRTTWDVADEIYLEGEANDVSALVIENLGALTSSETTIVRSAGIIVSGTENPSSWDNSGNVFVGGTANESVGVGSISIWGDAEINIGGTVMIWPEGSVFLNGGRLIADTILNTAGGDFTFQSGELQFKLFEGDLANTGGVLDPGGADAEDTLIFGHYTQGQNGLLRVDIGGTEPGVNYDMVNVASTAFLGGALQITMPGGFTPNSEDAFVVLAASSLIGSFDNVVNGQRIATTDGQGSMVVNYGPESAFDEDQIVLSSYVTGGVLLGDVNVDGLVNLLDVQPFVNLLNSGNFQAEADTNEDGVVDLLDVDAFVALLGGE